MQTVWDLETPVVTVDLGTVEHNIRRMQDYCDTHQVKLRPHIKTHKSPLIAKMQLEAGAHGITCQKLGEAELFAEAGFDDIFIPYNLLGGKKLARLMALSRNTRIKVAADSTQVVQGIAEAAHAAGLEIPVMVECDTGAHRTGVGSPQEALELGQTMDSLPGTRFAGLMVFPTNVTTCPPFLEEALSLFQGAGIPVETVSGGGTPQAWDTHKVPQITEHRPGTYIYNDRNTVESGAMGYDECAMRIRFTVVSRPEDRCILDGGSKSLAMDPLRGGKSEYGYLVEYPDAAIFQLSEEHANVDLSRCAKKPAIGEIVTVIPNHTCVVNNLHHQIVGIRGEQVETIWPVAARDRSQ